MVLFGSQLSELESRLLDNMTKTRSVFPKEIQTIELGLALMSNVTTVTKEAVKDYENKPNLVANHNLFARNRQLLLNAYVCALNSSYGTQFVIARTVLENNDLMRFFNRYPKHAFEWLSEEVQSRFSRDVQLRYGKSKKKNETFKPTAVRNRVFKETGKGRVKREIKEFYDQLCNYTHPNYLGWRELIGKHGEVEIILRKPRFILSNSDKSIGITLYLMQLSFKTFVETFKKYLKDFTTDLKVWQESYNKLIFRYVD
ncbi:MAG: hypothetical protein PVF15_02265 [Candidatus Bathyarchaeota archaeon]